MTKKERKNYIDQRSRELAETGKFSSWMEIEAALRGEGYPEARGELDSRYTRQYLDEICQRARR
jgi:hypothetical protein